MCGLENKRCARWTMGKLARATVLQQLTIVKFSAVLTSVDTFCTINLRWLSVGKIFNDPPE